MPLFLPFLVFLISIPHLSTSEPSDDKQALLDFLSKVPHTNRLDWNASLSACDWSGVQCDSSRSFVISLRLPAAGLLSPIPPFTLSRLSQLRVLSLHSNALSGPIPHDFSNLTLLKCLYLQDNQLSGDFPATISLLSRLTRLDISSNSFSGKIPSSLNNLTHLTRLYVQNNNFSGEIPAISGDALVDFNVSNNNLNGSVPKELERFPASAFAGNLQLCGGPLPPCRHSSVAPPTTSPSPTIVPSTPAVKTHKRLSGGAIAGIAVASAAGFLLLLLCLVFCLFRRRQQPSAAPKHPPISARAVAAAGTGDAGTSTSKDAPVLLAGEKSKLVFVDGGAWDFDLEDLLRASAEVLGKGSVGTTYKAVLEHGATVVVKRLKDVTAAKREFELQMEVLGGCMHQNVVPLKAYYYSKDEKLLVYDYFRAGSLSAMIHGSRGSGRTPLDWGGRMKTALAVARGLTYLHVTGKVVHGNVKSSNVLLRLDKQEPAVSDFGLTPLFGNTSTHNKALAYRAPEVLETRRVSFKSDVYSFGVLLLELITGKAPHQSSLGEEGIDLPRWVQSVVRDEWSAEVFDVELMRYSEVEEEMVRVLQTALSCVQTMPDQRPTMPDVLRMLEEIAESRAGNGPRQAADDPFIGSDGEVSPL